MRASSPLHPLDATSVSSSSSTFVTNASVASSTSAASFLPMRRSASSEWCEWEETLDYFPGLLGVDAAMDVDLGGMDQFLLATTDDFLEPFAGLTATPDSPIYEREQDLHMLQDAGFDTNFGGLQSLVEIKRVPQRVKPQPSFHHKRKTAELHRLRETENSHRSKKIKRQKNHCHADTKSNPEQAEKLYRRRYDILHGILEAWNTGGIEDLEEIADNVYDHDVMLISPNYSEGLHGVEAVLTHWNMLLDAFPDGIMEEYVIQREESSSEKMKATWTFSGTQIYPIFGVQPRHKKVCISGKSFFTFKGDKIRQMMFSWNYRETLHKLMGVQPDKANTVVLSAGSMVHTGAAPP